MIMGENLEDRKISTEKMMILVRKDLPADVLVACDDLGINVLLWAMHFGDINPYHADCEMCSDYAVGECDKSHGPPIECMQRKVLYRKNGENYEKYL